MSVAGVGHLQGKLHPANNRFGAIIGYVNFVLQHLYMPPHNSSYLYCFQLQNRLNSKVKLLSSSLRLYLIIFKHRLVCTYVLPPLSST